MRWAITFTFLLLAISAVPVLAAEPSPEVPAEAPAPAEAEPLQLPDAEDMREGIEAAEREEAERQRWLESPEATRQREESRYAFAELSAAAARELLLSTFSAELEKLNNEPARFLSDAQLVRPLGEDEAAATVKDEGNELLLDASMPVRAEDESGELRKVDLDLEPTPGGFEAINPPVEIRIPAKADQPVEIGEEGLAVTAPGAASESNAQLVGDKNAFYPEALGPGSDVDRLISPIAGGVEIFDLLRSAESPELLRFHIDMPEGANLRPDGFGGARIVKGEEEIASVPAPYAVDAQGSGIPVEMQVEGDDLILHVAHREAGVAYPLLVDPAIFEDWINPGLRWIDGGGLAALTNGSWKYDETHSWIHGNTSCIYYCWGGSNRGLFVSMPSGTQWEQQYGRWIYSAPNANSYLVNAWANPFVRQDYSNCHRSKYPKPHDYVGMWYQGKWNRFLNNQAAEIGSVDIQSWGESFILGLSTGGGNTYYSIPCWRDLYVGGVVVWLDDWQYPVIDSVSGIIPGKWFSDKVPLSVTVKASDAGLGVRRISLHPESYAPLHNSVGGCTGLSAFRCPTAAEAKFDFTSKSLGEGIRTLNASTEDPTGKAWGPYSIGPTMVDRTSPEVTLEGQLANVTGEKGSQESKDGAETLPLSVYNLAIKTTDGNPASTEAKDWRSGVKDIEVSLDKEEMAVPWSPQGCSGPKFSCPMNVNYTLGLSGIETVGMHVLEITAVDFAGNEHVRYIEFEYFPATGMKDEYVMHYFPLSDGLGNEAEEEHPARPEFAVNVMNGNLVYRERDFEVEGAAVDLELERFYNSQLPDSESTEWGEGWTLAETPELDPEEGPAPSEAEILDSSGALATEVGLPAKAGEEEFDPELRATIAKEADGGYELTDETGESATSVAFSESGRAEALRTEGYAKVDYVYEAGQLSEIEVQDPATFAADPKELAIASGLVEKPTFASSFGKNGIGDGQLKSPADVAVDSAGSLWVADRANNRIQKFGPDGKFLFKFGTSGKGESQFSSPAGIAVDPKGNLWVVDRGNNRIQKFDSEGKFKLQFGTYGSGEKQFSAPESIATDASGNVLVCDTGNARIQKFDETGQLLQVIGAGKFGECTGIDVGPDGRIWAGDWTSHKVHVFSGEQHFSFGLYGSGDGQFKNPDAIEVDSKGNVYVGDQSNHRVQLFDSEAKFVAKFGSYGAGEGQFNLTYPMGIETDSKGNLWVADPNNHRIQHWLVPITEPTYEGSFGTVGSGDGQLKSPADIAVGLGGSLWVADRLNSRIQKFSPDGKFLFQFGKYGEGQGEFIEPASVAVDRDGNLLVADRENYRVDKFDPQGEFITQIGKAGQLNRPEAVTTDFSGNVWVCDSFNGRIQRFDEEGKLIEVVGSKGFGEGQFGRCTGIDAGPDGRIWAADWTNNRVNVFGPDGKFLFQFGSFGAGAGQFNRPDGVEVDSKGNVWVGDQANHRIQLFDPEGKYVKQFGSNGSGPGQFKLAAPLGIETDSKGRLWVADVNNHRIQRWLTAHYAPVETEPIELSDGDPAVEVEAEGGLIATVAGNAAGEHAYGHEGKALVSHEGPEGETSYEYEGADRLSKVTLANGTWAEVDYDAYGRVKSVEVAPEGANAKTTYFEYKDTDPRRTTVIPPDAPHVVYDIGADGSVLKWWNKELPPELKLAGTLYDHKEKPEPIWSGDHWLESQAKSKEGIALIQVIANGNVLASEETCEQVPGPPIECTGLIIDQWVTSTDLHAPGHLQLEVIATDRIGNSSSERFWVDIPEPPPPASGSPVPPKFHQILEFREEYGLEIVFPVKNEVERNERIFDLINAWYEGDTFARATMEKWGVPLRPADVAELEYREWLYDGNAEKIDQWVEATSPGSYAGYHMDHPAGGIMRVGFLGNQAEQLGNLETSLSLVGGSGRLSVYPTPPTASYLTVRATVQSVLGAIESNPTLRDLVTSVSEGEAGKAVHVGTPNVTQVEGILDGMFGSSSPIVVEYLPPGEHLTGRFRNSGRMRAGDSILNTNVKRCTAGFGAYDKFKVAGRDVLANFVLTAGHCYGLDELVLRSPHADSSGSEDWRRVGFVKRRAYGRPEPMNTDAEAIRIDADGIVPRGIFGWGGNLIPTGPATKARVGNLVCFSGAHTQTPSCGNIVARERDFEVEGIRFGGYLVEFETPADRGDSGAPVWSPRTGASIGLVTGGNYREQTLVEPLLHPPRMNDDLIPGILRNKWLRPLQLKLGD